MVTSNHKRNDDKHSMMKIWSILLDLAPLSNGGSWRRELLLSEIHGVKWEDEGEHIRYVGYVRSSYIKLGSSNPQLDLNLFSGNSALI